ncbi:MAG: 3-hydroxyacyl-CoA dehydrogenase family protein [Clostridiales bacterium]|nr:3-hydroxyacyl-CoA dehydrogenase family protein [Clostridiales bacterium]
MIQPKVITVIGANGTMGCLVSGILASFGNAKVYMICRDLKKAKKAAAKAAKSVKADAVSSNLIPKTYDDLKECISESDWIFESTAECYEVKKEINRLICEYATEKTIVSTGTSGLSIEELSKEINEEIRPYYIGTHFFNPPYNMTLCEIIPTQYTNVQFLEEFKQYLSKVLYRSVVEVKDCPGFLANRIGFQFMNEALQYAEKYQDKGGIDYIDTILGQFTGRSMSPLVTADFVGLDIHKAIVDNIYNNTCDYAHDTFRMPLFVEELVQQGKLGRKTGEGLYKRVEAEDGKKETWVFDIETKAYRLKKNYKFAFIGNMIGMFREGNYSEGIEYLIKDESEEAKICLSFLLKYTIYSITLAKEIAQSIHDADVVMATGFNWVPAICVVEALGGIERIKVLCRQRLSREILDKINLEEVFDIDTQSQYDYRRYFKAKA